LFCVYVLYIWIGAGGLRTLWLYRSFVCVLFGFCFACLLSVWLLRGACGPFGGCWVGAGGPVCPLAVVHMHVFCLPVCLFSVCWVGAGPACPMTVVHMLVFGRGVVRPLVVVCLVVARGLRVLWLLLGRWGGPACPLAVVHLRVFCIPVCLFSVCGGACVPHGRCTYSCVLLGCCAPLGCGSAA
jgi:hypothetical protein